MWASKTADYFLTKKQKKIVLSLIYRLEGQMHKRDGVGKRKKGGLSLCEI